MRYETNHWAICTSNGGIRYDSDDNRAEIYGTRRDALLRRSQIIAETDEVLHVEKVEIQ